MNNEIFTTRNNLTMVRSKLFNWQRISKYHGSILPYIYQIYLGSFGGGWICQYEDGTKHVVFSHSSSSENISFKVDSIEEADIFVKAHVDATGVDLKDTIYYHISQEREDKLNIILNK